MAGASSPGTVTCASSLSKEVYNPKAFIPHAASLHQASAHCAIFPTAASRRSLGRVSVPVWPVALSGRLPVVALVGHHPTNKLIGREPIPDRKTFHPNRCRPKSYPVLAPVSEGYPKVQGRLLTCYSPVRHSSTPKGLSVRLACVKHAASVRPEPGSNSPTKTSCEKQPWQQTIVVTKGIPRHNPKTMPTGYQTIGTGYTSTLLSSQTTNTHHQPPPHHAARASGATPLPYSVASRCQVPSFSWGFDVQEASAHTKLTVSGDLESGGPTHRPTRSLNRSRPARAGFVTLPGRLRDRKSGSDSLFAPPGDSIR